MTKPGAGLSPDSWPVSRRQPTHEVTGLPWFGPRSGRGRCLKHIGRVSQCRTKQLLFFATYLDSTSALCSIFGSLTFIWMAASVIQSRSAGPIPIRLRGRCCTGQRRRQSRNQAGTRFRRARGWEARESCDDMKAQTQVILSPTWRQPDLWNWSLPSGRRGVVRFVFISIQGPLSCSTRAFPENALRILRSNSPSVTLAQRSCRRHRVWDDKRVARRAVIGNRPATRCIWTNGGDRTAQSTRAHEAW